MSRGSRVCVIGSANVDLAFRAPRFPIAGETLIGNSLHQGMGGKGANQTSLLELISAAVAGLGLPPEQSPTNNAGSRFQSVVDECMKFRHKSPAS